MCQNDRSSDKAATRLLEDGVMAERVWSLLFIAFDVPISKCKGLVPLRIVNNGW